MCQASHPAEESWGWGSSRQLPLFLSPIGRVFAWGMGTNNQLGTGQDEDAWSPVEMTGKQLENRVVLTVSSGGQHTVLLVKDKEQSW